MRLTIYRHGEILLPDDEKRFIGRTDYPLSDAGRKQICRVAEMYRPTPEAIYASSSSRCLESGQIFQSVLSDSGTETELYIRDDLGEIDLGAWENQTFAAVREKYPREFAARGRDLPNYRIPQAETFAEVQQRVAAVIRDIAGQTNSEVILITHLGVIRTLRCYYHQVPLSQMMEWYLDYGECLVIDGIHF